MCGYCKADVRFAPDSIVASIYDGNYVRDFCSKLCHESFEKENKDIKIAGEKTDVVEIPDDSEVTVTTPSSTASKTTGSNSKTGTTKSVTTVTKPTHKKSAQCSVCHKVQEVKHEVNFDGKRYTLCGDTCFNAFRYANKLAMNECSYCGAHCFSEGNNPHSIQFEGQTKKFCSITCVNAFKVDKAKTVPCTWCQAKKNNFDMIERVDANNKFQMFCSLNCLSLYRVNLQATSNQSVHCDQCKRVSPAQYHLTMSDASVRNFCQYNCVMAFQAQFTAPNKNASTPTSVRQPSQAAMPSTTPATRQSPRQPVKSRQGKYIRLINVVFSILFQDEIVDNTEAIDGDLKPQSTPLVESKSYTGTAYDRVQLDEQISEHSDSQFWASLEKPDAVVNTECPERQEMAWSPDHTADMSSSELILPEKNRQTDYQGATNKSEEGALISISDDKRTDSVVPETIVMQKESKPSSPDSRDREEVSSQLLESTREDVQTPCSTETNTPANDAVELESCSNIESKPTNVLDNDVAKLESNNSEIADVNSERDTSSKIAIEEKGKALSEEASQICEDTSSSISSVSKSDISDVKENVSACSMKTGAVVVMRTLKELCTQVLLSRRSVSASESFAEQVGIGHIPGRRGRPRGRPPGKHKHKKRARRSSRLEADDDKDPDFSLHKALDLMPKRSRGRPPLKRAGGSLVMSLKRVMSTESDSPDQDDDQGGLRKSTRKRTPTYKGLVLLRSRGT